ncbi:MAG: hypothetical protein ACXWUN_03395, partial [Allosphingosinicella sp.]
YARDGTYYVHQYTGRPDKSRDTGRRTLDWAREATERGAGAPEHFRDVFARAHASGALAATVFHDRLIAIPDLKEYLDQWGIEVRR